MQERRNFLKMVSTGSAGAILTSLFSQTGAGSAYADVQEHGEIIGELPDNLIYTHDRQGKWQGKAGSHLPQVKVARDGDKISLSLETKHSMSESHYIVRHTVVSAEGQVLGGQTFHWNDKPTSTHQIQLPHGHSQDVYVLSFCNKHDLWLAHTKIK